MVQQHRLLVLIEYIQSIKKFLTGIFLFVMNTLSTEAKTKGGAKVFSQIACSSQSSY